jgi:hypothetical protein
MLHEWDGEACLSMCLTALASPQISMAASLQFKSRVQSLSVLRSNPAHSLPQGQRRDPSRPRLPPQHRSRHSLLPWAWRRTLLPWLPSRPKHILCESFPSCHRPQSWTFSLMACRRCNPPSRCTHESGHGGGQATSTDLLPLAVLACCSCTSPVQGQPDRVDFSYNFTCLNQARGQDRRSRQVFLGSSNGP